jgi:hypothetical protein
MAFQIFDTNGDNKLSEQDMFTLISMVTEIKNTKNYLKPEMDGKIYPLNEVNKTQDIIPLNAVREDIFLDVFQDDFMKIIKYMNNLKEIKGLTDD